MRWSRSPPLKAPCIRKTTWTRSAPTNQNFAAMINSRRLSSTARGGGSVMDRCLVLLVCLLGALLRGEASAEGYLATDLQKLPDLVFGVDQTGFAVSTPSYRLTTGKAYQLTIVSTGKREYAIHADDFFNSIWMREAEVVHAEIKANSLYEIELEREGKATLVFVPIKPGKYRIYAKGLDAKGAVASIEVK